MDRILPPQYDRAFKDADIRGITGPELDDDLSYQIARAFVEEFKLEELVIGSDVRLSSPALVEAFIAGARDAGADVLNLGLCPSPLLYFGSGSLNRAGVMVTASHSPKEYNGLKLVLPGAVPLTKSTGLSAIQKRIKAGVFVDAQKRGRRRAKNLRPAYQRFVLAGIKKKQLAGLRIAADVGNGMASVVVPLLAEKLPGVFTTISGELDGSFPVRGSDPTLKKNQQQLREKLVEGRYDFGVAFDGDADRIAFLDENGEYVNCAIIGALIAEYYLEREPGAGIVFTNLTSRVFEEAITASGGKALRARVGHAFLKRKMRDTGAVFGAEHSGHFFFRDFFTTDSVVLTLLIMCEIYTKAKTGGQTFSDLVAPYRRYYQLEDAVIRVPDKSAVLEAVHSYLAKTYPEAKLKKFDGWFVSTPQAWGAVKPSVTEHAVKVMFEGVTRKDASAIQKDLVAYIKRIAKG